MVPGTLYYSKLFIDMKVDYNQNAYQALLQTKP